MRRIAGAMVLGALAVVLAASPAAADEDSGGFVIDSFTSDVTLHPDGTFDVVEEIAVDFTEERHGIYRSIPLRYPADADDVPAGAPADHGPADYWRVIEIDDLAVDSTAPADLATEHEGGALQVRIGNEDITVTGPQTYRIAYTVTGALDQVDDAAVLAWNVTGSAWEDIPMAAVEATVTAPAPITEASCAAGPTGSTQPCAAAEVDGQTARYRATDLVPDEQLTVRAALPADAVTVPPPLVTERWRLGRALVGSPLAWPLTAVAAVVAFGALALALRRGRDVAPPPGTAPSLRFDPPDDVRPAELSVVLEETVGQHDLSATIVDLAERGFLEIEQRSGDDDRDWRLRRRRDGDPQNLRSYERDLLGALFADGDEVDLSDLDTEFHKAYAAFRESVYAEAVRRGWFPVSPAAVRTHWLIFALVAVVSAVVVLVLALVLTEAALAAVPLVLAALAFLALHRVMPHRTAEGSRMRAEARGYRDGLAAQQPPPGGGGWGDADPRTVFGRNLPYAVAFGAVPALVRRMRTAGAPVAAWAPVWYIHPAGIGAWNDPDILSTDLGSFADQAGSGLTSAPSSGGGVAAGGGFGGGGGGGW